jgi:fatty-acyl-CoA synthase
LGPRPVLDIWEKATTVRELLPGLELVAVNLPGVDRPSEAHDLAMLLASQPDDRLVFGEPGRDDELAAYLHTGGTTGDPKLVTLTHRSQLVVALGGALLGDMNPGDVLSATLPNPQRADRGPSQPIRRRSANWSRMASMSPPTAPQRRSHPCRATA